MTEVDAIAQTCCADTSNYIFKKEPLSEDESRELFLGTVFGHEAGCPQVLKEVSNEIVKRSGGLPLAIIILSSLLAGQPASSIEHWNYIKNSLSSDSSTNTSLEGINQVLNLGYDNLPHSLKACMLYLCLYEEDCVIWKDDLVKQWMAEGFIYAMDGNGGKEVARSYFDELVNRGMIQPMDISCNDEILSFRVHAMVLRFIRYKSVEENFSIALDHSQTTIRLADKVRRLALHFGNVEHATRPMPSSMRLSQVRSLAFSGLLKCMPSFVEFRFIQVLILKLWADPDNRSDNFTGSDDLSGNITEPDDLSCNLSEISELFRLRYFHLDASHMSVELPTQMKRLKDLVAWEIDADVSAVPSDIVDLPGLFFLSVPSEAHLPTDIGRMTSLRTLGVIDLSKNSTENIMCLGELTNLQDLRLTCSTLQPASLEKNLECLGLIIRKLSNLKCATLVPAVSSHVKTQDDAGAPSMSISWNGFNIVPFSPALLQRLELPRRCCIFSTLPEWTKDLTKLGILKMAVRKVSSEDIVILKGLPSLTALSLFVWAAPLRRIIFDNEGFSVLKYFKFVCAAPCLTFLDGAMPKVRMLKLGFNANRMEQYSLVAAGFERLIGLKKISIKIGGAGADECDRRSAQSVLTDAISKHPNTPIISVQWVNWEFCGDDEKSVEAQKEVWNQTSREQDAPAGESTSFVQNTANDSMNAMDDMIHIISGFDNRSSLGLFPAPPNTAAAKSGVEEEYEQGGPGLVHGRLDDRRDPAVEEVMRVLEQWDSPVVEDRIVFESSEDAEECLATVACLTAAAGARVELTLPDTMVCLEEEFRQLLIRGTASLSSVDLHVFFLSIDSTFSVEGGDSASSTEGGSSAGTWSTVSDGQVSPYHICPDIVSALKDIADVMLRAGYAPKLCQVYGEVRRDMLMKFLAVLGVDKVTLEEVQRMEVPVLSDKMKKWTRALKVVVQDLLSEERRICSQIFAADADAQECFSEAAKGCVLQLLNFGDAVAIGKILPERLFRILDMYEALAESLPQLKDLFSGEARDFIKIEAERILARLGDAVRGTIVELANAIREETSHRSLSHGKIHPLARYVMNYVIVAASYSSCLNHLLDGCETELGNVDMTPSGHCVLTLITHLWDNIENKSKRYDNEALQNIFLMNHTWYIVQKVKDSSKLNTLLGDNWIRNRRDQIRTYSEGYLRSSWTRVLASLRDDGLLPNTTGWSSALKEIAKKQSRIKGALKERFNNFNLAYEELYRTQTAWTVVDPKLREELQLSISVYVLPAYGSFFGRYRGQLEGSLFAKYIK